MSQTVALTVIPVVDGDTVAYTGRAHYVTYASEDCSCDGYTARDEQCSGLGTEAVEVGKQSSVEAVLSCAKSELARRGHVVKSQWAFVRGLTFHLETLPPLPSKLSRSTILDALHNLGIEVNPDNGSVSFSFSGGRATVVRYQGEAPTGITIKK